MILLYQNIFKILINTAPPATVWKKYDLHEYSFLPQRNYFNNRMIEAKTNQIDQYLSTLSKNCLIWVDSYQANLVIMWTAVIIWGCRYCVWKLLFSDLKMFSLQFKYETEE